MPLTVFLKTSHFFKDFIYLFLVKGEGREKERERNISVWLPLPHHAQGHLACMQLRHVTWLGTEPVTLQFAGQHSIHTNQHQSSSALKPHQPG